MSGYWKREGPVLVEAFWAVGREVIAGMKFVRVKSQTQANSVVPRTGMTIEPLLLPSVTFWAVIVSIL